MSDSDLRVLLACDFFVRYTSQLAGALARAGLRVTLLTRGHDLEFGGVEGASHRFVEQAAGGTVDHLVLEGRVRSPRGLREAARMRRTIRTAGSEVKHVQSSITNDPRLLFASGIPPAPYALTVHDPVPHPGDRRTRRDLFFNRRLLRHASLVFVHGEALAEELRRKASPKAPIVVVPHGSTVEEPAPLPREQSILFFGRISSYKGLDVLLKAMPVVWRSLPQARLVIAGSGDLPSLDEAGIIDDPRLDLKLGYVSDEELPGLISASSCAVLPYRQASQSGVGSLMKSHGRPLVVTDVGALPELVADGSGIVVPAEDSEALADGLVRILDDRALAAELRKSGLRGSASTSWDSVASLSIGAYRQYLAR